MNTKRTPGPWNACCLETEAHYVFGPAGDETICVMQHNDPSDFNYEPASGTITKEERRANARLIAAAPDLLEALQELVKANEDWNAAITKIVTTPPTWSDRYLFTARAAIAKATGKEDA